LCLGAFWGIYYLGC